MSELKFQAGDVLVMSKARHNYIFTLFDNHIQHNHPGQSVVDLRWNVVCFHVYQGSELLFTEGNCGNAGCMCLRGDSCWVPECPKYQLSGSYFFSPSDSTVFEKVGAGFLPGQEKPWEPIRKAQDRLARNGWESAMRDNSV